MGNKKAGKRKQDSRVRVDQKGASFHGCIKAVSCFILHSMSDAKLPYILAPSSNLFNVNGAHSITICYTMLGIAELKHTNNKHT